MTTVENSEKDVAKYLFAITDDAEYAEAFQGLVTWVNGFIVPVYVTARVPSSRFPWCATWWEHPEALGRLHSLWLAYTALTADLEEAGGTGPSMWHRDHLDPIMQQLRAPDGPFAGCMTKPGVVNHVASQEVAVVEP
ncbi:DUF4913 domain-containing protein [Marinitenerispora sediminis]|uniref:DUF4913 domain-containing protein n=1 Tax=Marinitenerispora sediminis TaxID=1931232 RepID=UPI0018F116AF|nr:DUF4913 domain-containing protein [Marinitenerispora sediminis]